VIRKRAGEEEVKGAKLLWDKKRNYTKEEGRECFDIIIASDWYLTASSLSSH